jgi:hypothetical protein
MPEGIVSEYDADAGRGEVEDSSGRYAVVADDMASDTRFAGARVQFDIGRGDRRSDGEPDRAVNVRLRSGTRHNPKAKRFGDTGGSPTRG